MRWDVWPPGRVRLEPVVPAHRRAGRQIAWQPLLGMVGGLLQRASVCVVAHLWAHTQEGADALLGRALVSAGSEECVI